MRRKITIVCALTLVVVVTVCCTLLLIQSKNSILTLTTEQIKEKQENVQASFVQMARYYLDGDESETVKYSLLEYCFSQFADETAVLIVNDELLYSGVSISPEALLPVANANPAVFAGEVSGRNILIAGNAADVKGMQCLIYIVEDISVVYNEINAMGWNFIAICSAGILAGILLIVFLVKKSVKPLIRMGKTTRQIASGKYGERVHVDSADEVGQLANDFNTMAAAIQKQIEELTETAQRQRLFIGGVTHEFKTPLTGMMLHADTLRNTYMSEEEQDRSLAHIERQCRWLERLVQKLLKLVTLKEKVQLHIECVNTLFEKVKASTVQVLAKRKTPLSIECGEETFLMDMDLMQSLLVNLVDNASKASQPGQTILLRADKKSIEVKDEGCGMDQKELKHVLEPFYMADRSRNKKYDGCGLGLALVNEIAKAHGAKIQFFSELGKGTTVRIVFPVTKR